jgi:oligoribonuclease NrnB/cAMP/cGMP phosphodiesterase (DHH superfamily)
MVNNSTNINKTNKYLLPKLTEYNKDHDIWRWTNVVSSNLAQLRCTQYNIMW